MFWGNRVGKTEWGAMEVARYLLGEHSTRSVVPPVEVWCACPSFELQEETTQKKLLRYIPEHRIAKKFKLRGNILKSIVIDNGSVLTFKSYEQGREKFQGVGKRIIWFDEEPPHDIWEECSVREEAGEALDIILTMTPVKGITWVYDEVYLATDNKDIFVSKAGWEDNPWLTEDQKARMSRNKTEEVLKVRRSGEFVRRVGLVCNWWDRTVHIKHYDELDKSWTWFEVMDGGYSDPLAYLLIGVDHDDNVHVVKGFREKGLLTPDIKSMRDTMVSGITINTGYCDNDNPRLVKELKDMGVTFKPVEKLTHESKSWDEVLAEKLAEYGMIQKGTGKPRLYVSDNLVRNNEKTGLKINWLQAEMESLTWLETQSKKGSEQKPHWDDHRRFSHHFDGLRCLAYFLVSYKKEVPDDDLPPDETEDLFDKKGFY